jgi:hypothetical protein
MGLRERGTRQLQLFEPDPERERRRILSRLGQERRPIRQVAAALLLFAPSELEDAGRPEGKREGAVTR